MNDILSITVYEHYKWDPNYDGSGPIWYGGSSVDYSFISTDYDHVKEQGKNIRHTSKIVEVSRYYLLKLIYDEGPYGWIIAEKLWKLNVEYEKKCLDLYEELSNG